MKNLIATAVLLLAGISAHAHHSFSAEFDSEKTLTVTGVVTEVRFRNPHVQYFLDVESNGETARWVVAGQNMVVMGRSGVSADTIRIGDRISVSGYAGRNGAHKVYLETLVTAAGTTYAMYGDTAKRGQYAAPATEAVADPDSVLVEELRGDWAFDVDKTLPGAPLHLKFDTDGGNLTAILDNETVDVVAGENSFVMLLDRENRAGFPARMQLTGKIVDGSIEGTVSLVAGYSNFEELDASTFTAVRTPAGYWEPKPPAPLSPVDLTGVWARKIVLGPLGRTNPELNDNGKARHEQYRQGPYDPVLRCMNAGPLRRYAQRGDVEILATTNRLTMIYANGSVVRRLWLDRDKHSDDREHDPMGESIAAWDGSTLVVDTRNLTETVLTHNSEPVSSDARIVERFWLDDSGDLIMEATLHDPTYYERPLVKRLQWTRTDDQELLYAPCDPDSFYRGLEFDGELGGYFENQPD